MPGGLITEALEVENYPGYISISGNDLAQKFIRVESLNFVKGRKRSAQAAFRIGLTTKDGEEREQVVHVSSEEESSAVQLADRVRGLLPKNQRVSVTALSRVVWSLLQEPHE